MKNSTPFRFIACLVILALTTVSTDAFAGELARKPGELSHEAFLRGGKSISEALAAKTVADPATSANLVPPEMPKRAVPSAPVAQEGKSRRVMLWVGIAVTGVIAGYLVQKGVRDHNKIFTSQVD